MPFVPKPRMTAAEVEAANIDIEKLVHGGAGLGRAPDGRMAAILVNWTREEQPYEFESAGGKRRGVLPALSWRSLSMDPSPRSSASR